MYVVLTLKLIYAIALITVIYQSVMHLNQVEKQLRVKYENIFQEIYRIRKSNFKKNAAFTPEFNQSRFNIVESPVYCQQSDAFKIAHPDTILEDLYIWRDYPKANLQKQITMEKAFTLLHGVEATKKPGFKHEHKFPIQMSYLYTSVSNLYNNYHWGRGLGCVFQKYNHLPGKGSVAQKNQLIENFMISIKKLKDQNVTNPECKKNASFIPDTYRLNDEKDCREFFHELETSNYAKKFAEYGPQYILKTNEHRGEGITVLFEKEQKEFQEQYDYGSKCGKIKQQIIAQRYISNPFLYKGHKIEFRIYYLIVSTRPVIAYSYSRALIKRCAKPFSVHSLDKAAHVCNTAIVKTMTGKKSEDDIEDEEFFIDWYLEGLEELLIKQGRVKKNWLNDYLYPKIYVALTSMTRATYHTFARDSTFSEFFAVDFLLDNDLDVWVLEVNYNPQVLSVTPDRIKRNFKMVEDTFEVQFAYLRSKYLRLRRFLQRNEIEGKDNEIWDLMADKLEPEYQVPESNMYVKIIDEGIKGPKAYNNLFKKECLI